MLCKWGAEAGGKRCINYLRGTGYYISLYEIIGIEAKLKMRAFKDVNLKKLTKK